MQKEKNSKYNAQMLALRKGCVYGWRTLCGVIETGGVYEIIYRGGEL